VPNYYTIKVKEASPEILFTSTKPYYIPFYYSVKGNNNLVIGLVRIIVGSLP